MDDGSGDAHGALGGKERTMKKKTGLGERAVVICTARRGVFFGYSDEDVNAIIDRGTVTIDRARMCAYWSTSTKGVLGLAGIGPQSGSRIGPQVPSLTCESVTAVIVCSEAAAKAWESGVWS